MARPPHSYPSFVIYYLSPSNLSHTIFNSCKMQHPLSRSPLFPSIPTTLLVPTILATSILGGLLPPSKTRTISITTALAYLVSQVLSRRTGDKTQDGFLPIQALVLFGQWVSFFVLHVPENEYWRVREKQKKEKQGVEHDKGWWEKLKWTTSLKMTLRGVGWNWKVKNVPSQSPTSRSRFIRNQLAKAFVFYAAFDLIWFFVRDRATVEIFEESATRQVLYAWIAGAQSYLTINMQYPLFAAMTVALGIYEPREWPPLMGKLREVITVRGFWGGFWHQCIRRVSIAIFFQI